MKHSASVGLVLALITGTIVGVIIITVTLGGLS